MASNLPHKAWNLSVESERQASERRKKKEKKTSLTVSLTST
jgi:hypothetical protein